MRLIHVFLANGAIITPSWCSNGWHGSVAASGCISFTSMRSSSYGAERIETLRCAQFADATLDFPREQVPRNWAHFCVSVTDNFRVTSPKNFRVMTRTGCIEQKYLANGLWARG